MHSPAANSAASALSPTQRAWVTAIATTVTLLVVIVLGALA
ncbi:MAG TPA: hypothetical protein VHC18_00050 [Amycolatopsis sp.]|nr:hypothetical protein [Amycolatopsis sp.]